MREENNGALKQGSIKFYSPPTNHIKDRVLKDNHLHKDIVILGKCMPLLYPIRLVVDHMNDNVVFLLEGDFTMVSWDVPLGIALNLRETPLRLLQR